MTLRMDPEYGAVLLVAAVVGASTQRKQELGQALAKIVLSFVLVPPLIVLAVKAGRKLDRGV